MRRTVAIASTAPARSPRAGSVLLAHDERHLRRKAIALDDGSRVLVDLAEPVVLADGDCLVLDDGSHIAVAAARESLLEVRGRDPRHLAELAWHIGNRHLLAAVEAERILILRDHVIEAMLAGLGACLRSVEEPFSPVRGAYAGHGDHGHGTEPLYRFDGPMPSPQS